MNSQRLISKDNSLIIKGGGILLMLIHHLFYSQESRALYDDIIINIHGHELSIVHQIGLYGKLCVALFVFLSGYGITVSTPREKFSLKSFYVRRFTKLYLNYWFIILLFVPIGVFVFGRSLADVYGNHVFLKGILEFFGLLSAFGSLGYNPTWWFYSCIILLYLLYPLLDRSLSHHCLLIVTISLILSFCVYVPVLGSVSWYLLPFFVGMITARIPMEYINRIKPLEAFVCFVLMSVIRNFSGNMTFIIDTILCFSLAIMVYHWNHQVFIKKVFIQLGKHSMNMFLFHTFIRNYWFHDETYYTQNPISITLQFVIVCYVISVILEFVKEKIGFYKLCNLIISNCC